MNYPLRIKLIFFKFLIRYTFQIMNQLRLIIIKILKLCLTKKIICLLTVKLSINLFMLFILQYNIKYYSLYNNLSYVLINNILIFLCNIILDILQYYTSLNFIKGDILSIIEQIVNRKIADINFNRLDKINKKELSSLKNDFKYTLMAFFDILIFETVHFFAFLSYSGWLIYHQPYIVIIYILAFCFMKIHVVNYDDRIVIWNKYHFNYCNFYYDIIHEKADRNINISSSLMSELEKQKTKDKFKVTKHLYILKTMVNLVIIGNLFFFLSRIIDNHYITFYIQYVIALCNNITFIYFFIIAYKECLIEYTKIHNLLFMLPNREKYKQLDNFTEINIYSLSYKYPKNTEDNINLDLQLIDPIKIKEGDIVLITGKSGSGKTTLLDIIAGIIPSNEYKFQIDFNNRKSNFGFDEIITHRIYARQENSINWHASIYDIITASYDDKSLSFCEKALSMAKALDFIKINKDRSNKIWIYSKPTILSAGQKNRITIAKYLYSIFKELPKMVIFDEIDKNLEINLLLDIFLNIFNYCKKNLIICLITSHHTEICNLTYDFQIKINDGLIG